MKQAQRLREAQFLPLIRVGELMIESVVKRRHTEEIELKAVVIYHQGPFAVGAGRGAGSLMQHGLGATIYTLVKFICSGPWDGQL